MTVIDGFSLQIIQQVLPIRQIEVSTPREHHFFMKQRSPAINQPDPMPKHQEMVKHNMALLVPGASFENVTFNVAGTEVAGRGFPVTTGS